VMILNSEGGIVELFEDTHAGLFLFQMKRQVLIVLRQS
jgi:hypothetical protein